MRCQSQQVYSVITVRKDIAKLINQSILPVVFIIIYAKSASISCYLNKLRNQIISMLKAKQVAATQKYTLQIDNLKNVIRDSRQKISKLQNEANQSKQQITKLKKHDLEIKQKLQVTFEKYSQILNAYENLQIINKQKDEKMKQKQQQIQQLKIEIQSNKNSLIQAKRLKQENQRIKDKIFDSQRCLKQLKTRFTQVSELFKTIKISFDQQYFPQEKVQIDKAADSIISSNIVQKEVSEKRSSSRQKQQDKSHIFSNQNQKDQKSNNQSVQNSLLVRNIESSKDRSEKQDPKKSASIQADEQRKLQQQISQKNNSVSLPSANSNSKNEQKPTKTATISEKGKQSVVQPQNSTISHNCASQLHSNKANNTVLANSFISQDHKRYKIHNTQTNNKIQPKQIPINKEVYYEQDFYNQGEYWSQNNQYFYQQQQHSNQYLQHQNNPQFQQNYPHFSNPYNASNPTNKTYWSSIQQQQRQLSNYPARKLQQFRANQHLRKEVYKDSIFNQLSQMDKLHVLEGQQLFMIANLQKSKNSAISKFKLIYKIKKNKCKSYGNLYHQILNSTLSTIKEVNLSYANIEEIIEFQELKTLQKLDLSHNLIRRIKGFQTNIHIKILLLNDNKIQKLENLVKLRELHKICLHNNIFKKDAAEVLKQSNYSKLQQISISFISSNPQDELRCLATIINKNWQNLKRIYFRVIQNPKEIQRYRQIANQYNRFYQKSQDKQLSIII